MGQPKKKSHAKEAEQTGSASSPEEGISFVPSSEWEDVLLKSIRYHAVIKLIAKSGETLETTVARYEITQDQEALRPQAVHFSVGIDRENKSHQAFLDQVTQSIVDPLEVQFALPSDLVRCLASLDGIKKSKMEFALDTPFFRRFTRQFARVNVRIPVICKVFFTAEDEKDIWIRGEGVDLSEGGIGFIARESAAQHLPRVGDLINNLFFKVDGKVCQCTAIVRYIRLIDQNQYPQKRFRVGVEFVDPKSETTAHIQAVVHKEIQRLGKISR